MIACSFNLMASASAAGPLASGLEGHWCCIERRESRRSKLLHDSLRGWKTCQNGIKIVQNSTKFQSKSTKNRPKVDPGGFGGHLGSPDPFWDRFGHQLGFHLGSFSRPSEGHVGTMLAQKLILGGPGWHSKATVMFDTFLTRFGTDFESFLGSKMEPKLVQDRSQERS